MLLEQGPKTDANTLYSNEIRIGRCLERLNRSANLLRVEGFFSQYVTSSNTEDGSKLS